jgi:hypothetical protein
MDFGFDPTARSLAPRPPAPHPCGSSYSDDTVSTSSKSSDESDSDEHLAGSDNYSSEDITMSEEELKELTKDQLKVKLKALGLKVSGNKGELIERLLNPRLHLKKPIDWKKSRAKALLFKLLNDRESKVYSMSAREVYESHSWFSEYPFDRFKDNFGNLKKSVQQNLAIVDRDIKIITEELRNFPQSEESLRGYPRWDKHAARELLRKDIEDGKYTLGEAKQFQSTREEYLRFPSKVFRGHIHQERRRQRELPMKVIQRNKKAQKMHDKEVKEQEDVFNFDMDLADITKGVEKL